MSSREISGHVRTATDSVCWDCGNHGTDLYMDRLKPLFRCTPCVLRVAEREVEVVSQ